MKDMVPLGTGNSRYLKSSISADTTLAQLIALLRAGTLPVDLNGINAAGISQQGTPLTKATLLSDATASALGLSGDPTVNDALAAAATRVNSKAQFSSVGTYVGTGNAGSSYPNTLTFSFVPKIVIVEGYFNEYYTQGFFIPFAYTPIFDSKIWVIGSKYFNTDTLSLTCKIVGNTLTWYARSEEPLEQLNWSGITYKYVALG